MMFLKWQNWRQREEVRGCFGLGMEGGSDYIGAAQGIVGGGTIFCCGAG